MCLCGGGITHIYIDIKAECKAITGCYFEALGFRPIIFLLRAVLGSLEGGAVNDTADCGVYCSTAI